MLLPPCLRGVALRDAVFDRFIVFTADGLVGFLDALRTVVFARFAVFCVVERVIFRSDDFQPATRFFTEGVDTLRLSG